MNIGKDIKKLLLLLSKKNYTTIDIKEKFGWSSSKTLMTAQYLINKNWLRRKPLGNRKGYELILNKTKVTNDLKKDYGDTKKLIESITKMKIKRKVMKVGISEYELEHLLFKQGKYYWSYGNIELELYNKG